MDLLINFITWALFDKSVIQETERLIKWDKQYEWVQTELLFSFINFIVPFWLDEQTFALSVPMDTHLLKSIPNESQIFMTVFF